MPARALTRVVFPVFGLPTRATVGVRRATMLRVQEASRSYKEGYTNAGGFIAAQTQAVIAQTDFHGVAQRGEAEHLDFLVFEQAHFHEPLQHNVIADKAGDAGALSL